MNFYCKAECITLQGYTVDRTPVLLYATGGEPVYHGNKTECWVNSPNYFAEALVRYSGNQVIVQMSMPHFGDGPVYRYFLVTTHGMQPIDSADAKLALDKDGQPIDASAEANPKPAEDQLTLQLPS